MPQDCPQVSVVVATRNRADRLAALLGSLREQTLRRDRFEVLVVDDGSEDGTEDVLTRERGDGGLALSVLRRQSSRGPASARDAGWRAARAPLVAFTDDDCVADPNWLTAGVEAWAAHPGAIIQGRTEPNPDERHLIGPFSRTVWVREQTPSYETCNIFYPRELLERLGGFDVDGFAGAPPGGEDTDLAWRAIERGAKAVFADDARVFHAVLRLGPIEKLRFPLRWTETIQIFARHPEMKSGLLHGIFWRESHYLLLRALSGLLLPKRLWPFRRYLAAAYLAFLWDRVRDSDEGGGVLAAPYYALYDLIEILAVLRGALRYRTLVV